MIEKIVIAIPARLASKRLPNKVLKDINGKPMLRRVIEQCSLSTEKSEIFVCTDSEKISQEVKEWGCNVKVKLTSKYCDSGTERISSVLDQVVSDLWDIGSADSSTEIFNRCLNRTLVINVQGDQPFLDPVLISRIYEAFLKNPSYEIITPIYKLKKEAIHNPNVVKTLISNDGKALYFSRAAIPYVRGFDPSEWYKHYHYWGHIGLYAYKASVLFKWDAIPFSELEKLESLEQLRLIDSGFVINTIETDSYSISVDTEEQLEEARRHAIYIDKIRP